MAWGSRPQLSAKEKMRLDEIDFIGKNTATFNQIMQMHNISYTDLVLQLGKGIKVEKEHTGDPALAREIALDHLTEFPDYYSRLEKMEKK